MEKRIKTSLIFFIIASVAVIILVKQTLMSQFLSNLGNLSEFFGTSEIIDKSLRHSLLYIKILGGLAIVSLIIGTILIKRGK